MRLDWLSLAGFRSYSSLEWSPAPGVNLIVGDNGAGKTNLLEAVAYLGSLRSFRAAPDSALIATGSDRAVVRAGLASGDRERLIEIELPAAGPRRVQVDKARPVRSSELLGVIRVVAFLPEDLDLVKRGPSHRRQLLDDICVQLWPASHADQREYERALRQRNAFFRSGSRDEQTLAVWDARLSQAGGRVLARRARVIELLGMVLGEAYGEISHDDTRVSLAYLPSWTRHELGAVSAADYAATLDEALEAARRVDYERRMTTVGPHRDEPNFMIGTHGARSHASQGEQRSIALAVKLAAHRAIAQNIDENPILVLDDVFSELDRHRAEALAKALPPDTQTFITSSRPEEVPVLGSTWSVSDGRLS